MVMMMMDNDDDVDDDDADVTPCFFSKLPFPPQKTMLLLFSFRPPLPHHPGAQTRTVKATTLQTTRGACASEPAQGGLPPQRGTGASRLGQVGGGWALNPQGLRQGAQSFRAWSRGASTSRGDRNLKARSSGWGVGAESTGRPPGCSHLQGVLKEG